MQKGKYVEAIEWYNKALNINKLYPNAWFSLGCCYMKVLQFSKAAYAFGTVISLDN
jgi:tetratricopeptide (TPR) repeat protein